MHIYVKVSRYMVKIFEYKVQSHIHTHVFGELRYVSACIWDVTTYMHVSKELWHVSVCT